MDTIWAFDLGKSSIGEAVWNETTRQFDHVASLLIPGDFASTKEAASRRRMMRTRLAHKAREAWLDEVWQAAGQKPLIGRRVERVDGKWQLIRAGDERLEREFPPKGENTCYTSCLLRIKLLRGEKLEPWQIYKALHSAIQKRGYGRVPWAARELGKKELTDQDLEKELAKKEQELAKKDPAYRTAIEAWPKFKENVPEEFHYPCYYDAEKQGLWSASQPEVLRDRVDHTAESTRQVRFDREDVEKEIIALAGQAAEQMRQLKDAFGIWKKEGWLVNRESSEKDKRFSVHAAEFGEFLVYGPAGCPSEEANRNFEEYLSFRQKAGIHPGSAEDWLGVTAQKTPRFDNRIVNKCALLEGMQVCRVDPRLNTKTGEAYPDSLLACEVTFLMKAKNLRVQEGDGQRPLTVNELRTILEWARNKTSRVKPDAKNWREGIVKCYAVGEKTWGSDKVLKKLELRPLPGHEAVKPPKAEGRGRFSRPALKLIRALLLSGQKPSVFLSRLEQSEPALLNELNMDVLTADRMVTVNGNRQKNHSPSRPYVLVSQLKFLRDLASKKNSWEDIYLPEQRMDFLDAKHAGPDGQVDAGRAIRELTGAINDPIVRHRLEVFDSRLLEFQSKYGVPKKIALEFVREDFMGEESKRELKKFQDSREKARAEARERAREMEMESKSAPMRYELWKSQGGDCLYCGQVISMEHLPNCEIDHIVPQSKGGPDSMLNYVLVHLRCNKMHGGKGDKTPYEWLHTNTGAHGEISWDSYVKLVDKHATTLRRKKVQLLLREDAQELVGRYTALAETAWISRLAKKIVDLRFGWKNSVDSQGDLRVTVLSGGLTARIRRKYKLNSLLAEEGVTEEDAEKNRKDHRHHALDAMVLALAQGWARDPNKEKWFKFPEDITRENTFRHWMKHTLPHYRQLEKPKLAETIYGSRGDVIVQRVDLLKLAYRPVTISNKVFDLKYAKEQFKSVRDPCIRQMLNNWLIKGEKEEGWLKFVKQLRVPAKGGRQGPLVKRVLVNAGSKEEYLDMSKDNRGAWRKAKKSHRGQIVYLLRSTTRSGKTNDTAKVCPVYIFESEAQVRKRLYGDHGENMIVYGFFQSKCMISVECDVHHGKMPLPAGTYMLNTIKTNGDVKVTRQDGKSYPDIPQYRLQAMIKSGLKRVT